SLQPAPNTVPITDLATRQIFALVPVTTPDALDALIDQAQTAAETGRIVFDPQDRARLLEALADALSGKAAREVAEAEARASGVTWRQLEQEVLPSAVATLREASRTALALAPASIARQAKSQAVSSFEPSGVTALIVDGEAPLLPAIRHLANSLAVGTPLIIRPTATSALSLVKLEALARKQGFAP